jgi:hypothetical protein
MRRPTPIDPTVREAFVRLLELHELDDAGRSMMCWFSAEEIARRVAAARAALNLKGANAYANGTTKN